MFTVTTPVGPDVEQAAAYVRQLCPSARATYALAGTQKYELPTSEVSSCVEQIMCLPPRHSPWRKHAVEAVFTQLVLTGFGCTLHNTCSDYLDMHNSAPQCV